ncbi:unnamed protein product [Nesidiocoris tenuis]|uniref:Calpain catalytic domain-containing protein n=1 Tax=Nesidiocoris tenuis TaxID=355587 RepID=A0A6H5H3Z8_9HEMI|nr:unnamed protein product [Nesidiocoris tenuis]
MIVESIIGKSTFKPLGERGSGLRPRSENVQDFHKIRSDLLARGDLFEDPEFPATDASLFFSQRPSRRFEWKRPMADPNVTEAQMDEGLVKGHAYSITRVQYVDISTPNTTGKIPLLRLRNPWGNEAEWNGPWSDKSAEWRFISDEEKQEIGLVFEYDGEFWMSFKDFIRYFSRLEICNLSPDSLTEAELRSGDKKKWEMSVFEGEWVRGVTAGGCRNFLETFWHNPQYIIELTDADEDDEDNKCTILIALMQKNRRSQRKVGAECLTVGFAVYHRKRRGSWHRRNRLEGKTSISTITNPLIKVKDAIADTPEEEEKKSDRVKEFFLKLAGEDEEVDWVELKEILDYAMRHGSVQAIRQGEHWLFEPLPAERSAQFGRLPSQQSRTECAVPPLLRPRRSHRLRRFHDVRRPTQVHDRAFPGQRPERDEQGCFHSRRMDREHAVFLSLPNKFCYACHDFFRQNDYWILRKTATLNGKVKPTAGTIFCSHYYNLSKPPKSNLFEPGIVRWARKSHRRGLWFAFPSTSRVSFEIRITRQT